VHPRRPKIAQLRSGHSYITAIPAFIRADFAAATRDVLYGLPECAFRGRQLKKLQYAVLAAAALHGGTEPNLLDEVAWWQTDDFWQYALYAAIAHIRAAASRVGVPVRQACQELAGPTRTHRSVSGLAAPRRAETYCQLDGVQQRAVVC
jgi:hypothetical protein